MKGSIRRVRLKGQINPIYPPKIIIKRKGDKTKPSKTHHVPENQLNSLQQLTTLAYLHSSQVAGFGVKQGLFKVLLLVWGLCWVTSSYTATVWLVSALKVLLWMGTKNCQRNKFSQVALEQVDLQCLAVHSIYDVNI